MWALPSLPLAARAATYPPANRLVPRIFLPYLKKMYLGGTRWLRASLLRLARFPLFESWGGRAYGNGAINSERNPSRAVAHLTYGSAGQPPGLAWQGLAEVEGR